MKLILLTVLGVVSLTNQAMADGELAPRKPAILLSFPAKPAQFQPDVRPYVGRIIASHGDEEWKAALVATELHRHLGIFSIIGAKMGIRARALLHAPLDGIRVVSLAGNDPPLSCLNDGLQVATGASLGRGGFELKGGAQEPAAVFTYRRKRVMLTLRRDVAKKIASGMREIEKRFPQRGEQYFAQVRALALRYWLELDRHQIFKTDWLR